MTTTLYTSNNSRPCADCGLRRCPHGCNSLDLLTSILPGDVTLPRGWVLAPYVPGLPSGPVDGEIVNQGEITVTVTDLAAHPADYMTFTGVMDAISNGPQIHHEAWYRSGRVPVWPVALILAGLVLMAIGWVFNPETTAFIMSLMPKG